MTIVYLEYIWHDSKGQFRSKIKITDMVVSSIKDIPVWNYDGSSTGQAEIETSEVLLIPIAYYRRKLTDSYEASHFPILVLCDTRGVAIERPTIYESAKAVFDKYEETKPMFGLEQEFFMLDNKGQCLKGDDNHYCGVGLQCSRSRPYLLEIMYMCEALGIKLTGMNYEVAAGQAEFQVCSIGIAVCHDLIILRYLLVRMGETHGIQPNFEPKPLSGVNGSGCHLNFSTRAMRDETDNRELMKTISTMCGRLKKSHDVFIDQYYGTGNKDRLTGTNETSSYKEFTVKKASRSVSVRIPTDGNYFEDRRPSSNINPYLACSKFLECVVGTEPL
jgi:glutamine synthetase